MPGTSAHAAGEAPRPAGGRDLDAAWLRAEVVREGRPWTAVTVAERTGSTNADLLALARGGAPEGLVLAAREQTAGRGRLGRSWVSPPGRALAFSVLLRPGSVPRAAHGWLPLLSGVAVARAVRSLTGLPARLKWPNDVLAGERKLAGILAEQDGDAVVIGVGLNVAGGPDELPVPTATSLEAQGAGQVGRGDLLAAILAEMGDRYVAWRDRAGDADRCGLRREYLALSATAGRAVLVQFPDGRSLGGLAAGVDGAGRLLIRPGERAAGDRGGAAGDLVAVSAGDVVHVR